MLKLFNEYNITLFQLFVITFFRFLGVIDWLFRDLRVYSKKNLRSVAETAGGIEVL